MNLSQTELDKIYKLQLTIDDYYEKNELGDSRGLAKHLLAAGYKKQDG
jgi:hypothetical protein